MHTGEKGCACVAVHKTGGGKRWESDEIGSSGIAFLGLLKLIIQCPLCSVL